MKFSLQALFILTTIVAAIAGAVLSLPVPLREAALLILAIFVFAGLMGTGVIVFTMLVCAVIDYFLEHTTRSQTIDKDDSQAVKPAP